MYQIIPQTHEQKKAMYQKCTKEELIEMLIEANRLLDAVPITHVPYPFFNDYAILK